MATTILRAGDALPTLTLPRLDGESFDFGTLRGERSLLFFWGSW